MSFLTRTELLFDIESIDKLKNAHILVVGLGGVGSYAVEALARAGIGHFTLIDGDIVQESNINRQLQALHSTIGRSKVDLICQRLLDINPAITLLPYSTFLHPEDIESILQYNYTFVLDCIDTIAPKIELITQCKRKKIKCISAMGAGGKTDPSRIQIAEIRDTKDCYFSRDIRKRLRRLHYNYGIKVVYSDEVVNKSKMELCHDTLFKRSYYGTISYMPAMFGMTMASYVIKQLTHSKV